MFDPIINHLSLVCDINFPDNFYFIIPCGYYFVENEKINLYFFEKNCKLRRSFLSFYFLIPFFVRLFIFDCGTVIFTLSADLLSHRTLIICFCYCFYHCKNIMWFLINLKKYLSMFRVLTLPVHYNKIFFNNVKYVWYILFHHPPMIVPL